MTSVYGHQLGADWSRHGTYTGALEDLSTGYVLDGDIEISWGRDVSGEVTLATSAGQMTFGLNNEGQEFSPENSASPIVGRILPNVPIRYQVTHQSTIYPLLEGVLDSYDVDGDPVLQFAGTVLDAWGRPGAEKLSTPLYRGIRTGDAVNVVLDAIGWTGLREIDPGATCMPYWWEEGADAATAIDKLVHSEGAPAIAYVRGGTFVFKDRHHRLTDARSLTSQGTYSYTTAAAVPVGALQIETGSFRYNHGTKRIINSATFSVEQRAPQPLGEVWTSDDPLTVAVGQTVQIVVQPDNPFHSAVTPSVAAGDIRLLSGAVSAVTLSRDSGQSAVLSITCSAATVISRLALRAVAVTVARTVQVSARDVGSIGRFEVQELPSDAAPVWANVYDAQIIATRIVAICAGYRPTITFTIVGLNDTYLAKMLQQRISDRITVRHDRRGILGDFVVERIAHRITNLGAVHRLEVTCEAVEPAQPANVLTFGVAGAGFNDGAFGVEGIDNPANMFRFDVAGQGFNDGRFAS